MIIRLSPNDSSILARVAQYSNLDDVNADVLDKLLSTASPEAKEVGQVLLGKLEEGSVRQEIAETADYFRDWARANRAYSTARVAAG